MRVDYNSLIDEKYESDSTLILIRKCGEKQNMSIIRSLSMIR